MDKKFNLKRFLNFKSITAPKWEFFYCLKNSFCKCFLHFLEHTQALLIAKA